jgi:hypothetical protein
MHQLRESPPDTEALRFYLTFPLHGAFEEPSNAREVHFMFAERCLGLKGAAWKVMEKWVAAAPASWLRRLVTCYKAAALPFLQLADPSNTDLRTLQVRPGAQ